MDHFSLFPFTKRQKLFYVDDDDNEEEDVDNRVLVKTIGDSLLSYGVIKHETNRPNIFIRDPSAPGRLLINCYSLLSNKNSGGGRRSSLSYTLFGQSTVGTLRRAGVSLLFNVDDIADFFNHL